MAGGQLDRENEMAVQHYDVVGQIMAYEQGDLDEDAVVELFQNLVNDGTIAHLQGSYQRAAQQMFEAGLIDIVPSTHQVH
jgi:hypothetical protein